MSWSVKVYCQGQFSRQVSLFDRISGAPSVRLRAVSRVCRKYLCQNVRLCLVQIQEKHAGYQQKTAESI